MLLDDSVASGQPYPHLLRFRHLLVRKDARIAVRSAKSRDLAHRLSRRENRSIADIIERALEAYEVREAGREPASAFYARMVNAYGTDIDLEAVIRDDRRVHTGHEL